MAAALRGPMFAGVLLLTIFALLAVIDPATATTTTSAAAAENMKTKNGRKNKKEPLYDLDRFVPVSMGVENIPKAVEHNERCISYQVTRLDNLTPHTTSAMSIMRAKLKAGGGVISKSMIALEKLARPTSTFRELRVECRPALSPHLATLHRRCMTDFGPTIRSQNFMGIVTYNLDKGERRISVDFSRLMFDFKSRKTKPMDLRMSTTYTPKVTTTGSTEDGPVFTVCGAHTGMQCEVLCDTCGDIFGTSHKSLGVFRVSPGTFVFSKTYGGVIQTASGKIAPDSVTARFQKIQQAWGAKVDDGPVIDISHDRVLIPTMIDGETSTPTSLRYLNGYSNGGFARVRLVRKTEAYNSWIQKLGERVRSTSLLGKKNADLPAAQRLLTPEGLANSVLASLMDTYWNINVALHDLKRSHLGTSGETDPSRNSFKDHGTCPMTFAHRGVTESSDAVENSLVALVQSMMKGYDGAEVDVFLVGSNEVGWSATVLHDKNLDRLTGIDMDVAGWADGDILRFNEIKSALEICRIFPALDEVLTLSRVFDFNLDIELKPALPAPLAKVAKGYSKMIGKVVGNIIRETDMQNRVVVTAFDPAKLRHVNGRKYKDGDDKHIPVALAYHGSASSAFLYTASNMLRLHGGAKSRIFQIGREKKGRVERTHKRGGYAGLYTFADLLEDPESEKGNKFYSDETVARAVDLGIDWIEADDMVALEKALAKTKCKPRVGMQSIIESRQQLSTFFRPAVDGDIHRQYRELEKNNHFLPPNKGLYPDIDPELRRNNPSFWGTDNIAFNRDDKRQTLDSAA